MAPRTNSEIALSKKYSFYRGIALSEADAALVSVNFNN